MKTNFLILVIAALFLQAGLSSCSRSRKVTVVRPVKVKTLPPGQAKKISGSQSAKAYAPGQQKKKH